MIATKTVKSFIGGKFRESRADRTDPMPNPATGETIASLPHSTREEINEAVAAAKKAFPAWSETPVPERAQVMFRFKALFDKHIDELSAIVTQENGKTLDESRGEIKRAIEVIDFACGAPTLMMGQNLDQIATGIDEELTRFPVGGAKNPILVMDDADLELSAPHVISSAFGNAGQRCLAGSVAVGVGKIGDALVRELASDAAKLKVGPGTDPKTTLGPVIRRERKKKLIEYIDGAQSEGAQLVSDGRHVDQKDGFFLGPTIFDRVTPNMKIWKEELFGPVLSVMRATDIDEALKLLNASTFGNMASIFTGSGKYAREFKRRAQAGMLGVNIGVAAPMAVFPFHPLAEPVFLDSHA